MDKPSFRKNNSGVNHKYTKYNEIIIYLKTGHKINVTCKDFMFFFNKRIGEFTGYEFEELISPLDVGISPAQIAAYIVIK